MKIDQRPISEDAYERLFEECGGSFSTHPKVLSLVAQLADIPIKYIGLFVEGSLLGAMPMWGKNVMLNAPVLRAFDAYRYIDPGHSEIILPLSPALKGDLSALGILISPLHSGQITNLTQDKRHGFAFAKPIQSGENRMSKKSRGNRNREWQKLLSRGAQLHDVRDLSTAEFKNEYARVFTLQRQKPPHGHLFFPVVFETLHDFVSGKFIALNDKPIAIQKIYSVNSGGRLCVNFVNSAVAPEYAGLSAGSALIYQNILAHEDTANSSGTQLRYCFGTDRAAYKSIWCYSEPSFYLRKIRPRR